jgi:murein L,D-transpeptidase YcbB/YkuD
MARWRWQAHDLGENYIMVNIAGFSLSAVKNGETILEMPVIVGKSQHQTPVFSDTIRYLDFNPFWNITTSIARNEELPALRKNPKHLVERNIRLFSSWQEDAVELDSTAIEWSTVSRAQMSRYKLRQDPGPWNALGRVKFVFPNHHSVYLHDTPTRELFDRSFRSFSHGCIRVSRPLALALFALELEDPLWSSKKIDTIVASGERKVIALSNPLPIHITYQTVWLDNQGIIRFNSDLYNRDARLLEVLLSQ